METAGRSDELVSISLHMSLPAGFPASPPSIQVQSMDLSKGGISSLSKSLSAHLAELDPEESPNLTLEAINYCTEQVATDESLVQKKKDSEDASMAARRQKNRRGFMREWSSFVSLYKDSYISGPNRFEVLSALANDRGLAITGLAISGKPGGIVVEGPEGGERACIGA